MTDEASSYQQLAIVVRARRKIGAYRAAGDTEKLTVFLSAWLGHARWADSANLLRSLELEHMS